MWHYEGICYECVGCIVRGDKLRATANYGISVHASDARCVYLCVCVCVCVLVCTVALRHGCTYGISMHGTGERVSQHGCRPVVRGVHLVWTVPAVACHHVRQSGLACGAQGRNANRKTDDILRRRSKLRLVREGEGLYSVIMFCEGIERVCYVLLYGQER